MKMIDLGKSHDGPKEMMEVGVSEKPPKKSYPSFSLSDEHYDENKSAEVGDVYTAMVKLKVKGKRNDEYSRSLDFDVLSMSELEKESEEGMLDDEDMDD